MPRKPTWPHGQVVYTGQVFQKKRPNIAGEIAGPSVQGLENWPENKCHGSPPGLTGKLCTRAKSSKKKDPTLLGRLLDQVFKDLKTGLKTNATEAHLASRASCVHGPSLPK